MESRIDEQTVVVSTMESTARTLGGSMHVHAEDIEARFQIFRELTHLE